MFGLHFLMCTDARAFLRTCYSTTQLLQLQGTVPWNPLLPYFCILIHKYSVPGTLSILSYVFRNTPVHVSEPGPQQTIRLYPINVPYQTPIGSPVVTLPFYPGHVPNGTLLYNTSQGRALSSPPIPIVTPTQSDTEVNPTNEKMHDTSTDSETENAHEAIELPQPLKKLQNNQRHAFKIYTPSPIRPVVGTVSASQVYTTLGPSISASVNRSCFDTSSPIQ